MHLHLIVKGTRLCNLRCAYCHDWKVGHDQTMTFAVMARMIATALRDAQHEAVTFVWHGGETTLLPIAFYEKAILLQSQFRRPGQRISNGIQTNATRLTPEWVRFFSENEFHVGVSLDGPPEIHDLNRYHPSGAGSFAEVARGIQLLKDYEVPFGLLMVIDRAAIEAGADKIFDFFLEHGITHYALAAAKPINQPGAGPGTPTSHYIDPATMTAFLIRMYDRWCEHGNPNIHIRELAQLQRQISGRPSNLCTLVGKCFGTVYLVEPDGEVAHCDYFIGDTNYTLGNVLDDDFQAFRCKANMLALRAENERCLAEMSACPEFNVCNGWCPHERYLSARHNLAHHTNCCGLRELIDHIRKNVHRSPSKHSAPALATSPVS